MSRKDVSLQLREMNRSKDRFFSVLAHDLRGPINSFLNVTDMLREQGELFSPTEQKELLDSLSDYAHKLSNLLDNLLSWSRLKVGTMHFDPIELEFDKLLVDSIEIVNKIAEEKDIEIETSIECDTVELDKDMMASVIRNLLTNAMKFSRRGQTVLFGCLLVDDEMMLYVEDHGIGMSEELKSKVLTLGKKTGRPGTEGEPSSGLGLILVSEFVAIHGGRLQIRSEEEKGTRVEVILPLRQKKFP